MNERHPGSATHVADALTRLRAESPLIHNITNYVVMNSTANALLAIGASPAMVHAREEVADFTSISRALVINIGTLSAPWVAATAKCQKVSKSTCSSRMSVDGSNVTNA